MSCQLGFSVKKSFSNNGIKCNICDGFRPAIYQVFRNRDIEVCSYCFDYAKQMGDNYSDAQLGNLRMEIFTKNPNFFMSQKKN